MSATLGRWQITESSEQLGWGFLVSLGIHMLMVALIMFWPGWGFSKREIFAPVYNVNLVGGPPQPPAPAAPKPAAKPTAKPTPTPPVAKPKPAPKPEPKKEAIATKKEAEKPKRLEPKKTEPQVDQTKELEKRIKRLQQKVAEERAMESAISRLESRVQARSGGGGGPAGGSSQLSAAFQLYYTNLKAQVHRSWVLPENAGKKLRGLEAIIVIRIRRDGQLDRVWLEKGSGNSRLDTSAIRAVERAAPFPPLPSETRERVHEVGFRFRPEDITG